MLVHRPLVWIDRISQELPIGDSIETGLPSGGTVNGIDKFTSRVASQSLGGHRIVVVVGAINCDYADNAIFAHGDAILGFTIGAAIAGAAVTIQSEGEIEFSGWSWAPNALIFVGTNGLPVSIPPDQLPAVFSCRVAVALTATRIFIDIETPIF